MNHELLSMVLREFDDPRKYAGVLLVGSVARGDAGPFSDIDLVFYSLEEPSAEQERYRLVYRDQRLISLTMKTLEKARAAFTSPTEAIEDIQGLRDSLILRDSDDGALSGLREAAIEFQWSAELREAAMKEASYQLMGYAEEVHKILRGLSTDDSSALLNGAWGLASAMPVVMALRHNILSAGENLFRMQVCEAVGAESPWARFHAIAIGQSPGPTEYSRLAQQAIGAFWLYEETARLSAGALLPGDAAVVEQAVLLARGSGLIPDDKH